VHGNPSSRVAPVGDLGAPGVAHLAPPKPSPSSSASLEEVVGQSAGGTGSNGPLHPRAVATTRVFTVGDSSVWGGCGGTIVRWIGDYVVPSRSRRRQLPGAVSAMGGMSSKRGGLVVDVGVAGEARRDSAQPTMASIWLVAMDTKRGAGGTNRDLGRLESGRGRGRAPISSPFFSSLDLQAPAALGLLGFDPASGVLPVGLWWCDGPACSSLEYYVFSVVSLVSVSLALLRAGNLGWRPWMVGGRWGGGRVIGSGAGRCPLSYEQRGTG
jgi:hypothetical protein